MILQCPFPILKHFETREMCIKGVEVDLWQLSDVPDHFKTQEMCNEALHIEPYALRFVPVWFVIRVQVKICHDDDDDYWNDDEIIKWYDGYQKLKAQKAKIQEVLMHIAWYSLRWWDWCMSEDKKKREKNCGSNR